MTYILIYLYPYTLIPLFPQGPSIQLPKVLPANRFGIVRVCEIREGKVGKGLKVFLFYANFAQFMRNSDPGIQFK